MFLHEWGFLHSCKTRLDSMLKYMNVSAEKLKEKIIANITALSRLLRLLFFESNLISYIFSHFCRVNNLFFAPWIFGTPKFVRLFHVWLSGNIVFVLMATFAHLLISSCSRFWTPSSTDDYFQRMKFLGNQTDRIGFNSAVNSIIIFASCLFTYVNDMLRVEYNQRVIIRFLHNEAAEAHNTPRSFMDNLSKIVMHFEQSNSGLARYVAIIKTSMMKFA
jgi:hypothetical protein